MPSYELALLTRLLPRPDLTSLLKRTANTIFDHGGIIRKIENLGSRNMPYKTSMHGTVHREANYFMLEFDAPPFKLSSILSNYSRDIDIIRGRIYKVKDETSDSYECTLEEEMKSAPYRLEVIKMIEEGKKKEARRRKFKYNTGLDYYPFQT